MGWEDYNHAGRLWWDVSNARGRLWNGLASLSLYGHARVVPPFGAMVTINSTRGDWFFVTATSGTAFSVTNPTNPSAQQVITITIRNASGGALGKVTWGAAYRLGPWTSPASGSSRSITFAYDGAHWVEIGRTIADVPD